MCLPRYQQGGNNIVLWKQLLKNKFLFLNCKNEDFSTEKLMERKFNSDRSDSGLAILRARLREHPQEVRSVFREVQRSLKN